MRLLSQPQVRLKEILQYNLKSVRTHLLREDFRRFWEYTSPEWAAKFIDAWCTRTMRSRIGPMKKIARSLRRHRHLILNWFRARGAISSGVVEGFNGKAKLTRHVFKVPVSDPTPDDCLKTLFSHPPERNDQQSLCQIPKTS
jgi:transposase